MGYSLVLGGTWMSAEAKGMNYELRKLKFGLALRVMSDWNLA